MLLPPVGLLLYLYMGINWRSTVLNERFSPEMAELISNSLGELEGPNEDIARLVSNVNASPLFIHNEVTLIKMASVNMKPSLRTLKDANTIFTWNTTSSNPMSLVAKFSMH